MTEEPALEESIQLGAQLPPVAPDEVPGMLALRDLSSDEKAQYDADAGLIRSIAPLTPYARASDAVRMLGGIVEALDADPNARARKRLARALDAVSHAMGELPDSLVAKLPDHEPFAEAVAKLQTGEAFQEVLILRSRKPDQLSRENAQNHLTVAHEALISCARLLASWLLAQREAIDAASRRIARLGGEVIEGIPAVMTIRIRRRNESGDPNALDWVPDPLPLIEIQNLQAALRRAEQVLSDEPHQPAERGARAMYGEQVAATLGIPAAPAPDHDAADAEAHPSTRALNFDALMAHLLGGAARLEMAWSRALEFEDVATLSAEWISFLHAIAGEVAHADRHLDEEEARIELPLPDDDAVGLPLDRDDASSWIAETIAVAWLAQGVDALRRPTNIARDASGHTSMFFSSGAFARMRDQLELIAALRSDASDDRAAPLARRAMLRGDPEAVVLHAADALRRRGDLTGPLQSRILEAAERLISGEPTNLATVTVLADAALRFVSGQ